MKVSSFDPDRDLIFIAGRIPSQRGETERRLRLVLDTGAAETIVVPEVLDELGYNPRHGEQITVMRSVVGREHGEDVVAASAITAQNVVLAIDCQCMNSPVGMSVGIGDYLGACVAGCGDGIEANVEGCDDGNVVYGDGCSAGCRVEATWSCDGAPSNCLRDRDGDGVLDAFAAAAAQRPGDALGA